MVSYSYNNFDGLIFFVYSYMELHLRALSSAIKLYREVLRLTWVDVTPLSSVCTNLNAKY